MIPQPQISLLWRGSLQASLLRRCTHHRLHLVQTGPCAKTNRSRNSARNTSARSWLHTRRTTQQAAKHHRKPSHMPLETLACLDMRQGYGYSLLHIIYILYSYIERIYIYIYEFTAFIHIYMYIVTEYDKLQRTFSLGFIVTKFPFISLHWWVLHPSQHTHTHQCNIPGQAPLMMEYTKHNKRETKTKYGNMCQYM